MARYTGARCKLCRREGIKLYLKGDRCYTNKCAFERRSYAPGQHGQVRKKVSEYGLQLRAKQKARRIYGVMERQFRNYFYEAARQPGVTGENLLRLLERRLDNVVFRLGLADSRAQARQLVTHGHFKVNGRKVNIPSYLVKVGDEITVREKSKNSVLIKSLIDKAKEKTHPAWLEYDAEQAKGGVISLPTRDQIDVDVEEHLIVELYSK
ncbi:30S ribosomal protein S4 [Peptococcaceae bacterium]|nr:30S ribosomal protein S4 [Desulfotomaculum sp.]MCL0042042.1 30S ribosomal protein S4 [Peptococcaceae bacterium]MCL0043720.1 30S ribosomal protein S4 [Peptococcaceae bacterium]MCL0062789.1 30S ribosomal protein S4 [Peptococcaceae bacterium]MCL0067391.1 30S ribosomal protein S4 [Peptococcaceae bacterium]